MTSPASAAEPDNAIAMYTDALLFGALVASTFRRTSAALTPAAAGVSRERGPRGGIGVGVARAHVEDDEAQRCGRVAHDAINRIGHRHEHCENKSCERNRQRGEHAAPEIAREIPRHQSEYVHYAAGVRRRCAHPPRLLPLTR